MADLGPPLVALPAQPEAVAAVPSEPQPTAVPEPCVSS